MGTWGVLAFDNDNANDWAYDLDGVHDLSLVESTFAQVESVGAGNLEAPIGENALAACEVLARLRGRPGYQNAYTEKVDSWVAAHKIEPPAGLIKRGNEAINLVLGDNSELRDLWEEVGEDEWQVAVADLRTRLTA
jgi:hypothetical protein